MTLAVPTEYLIRSVQNEYTGNHFKGEEVKKTSNQSRGNSSFTENSIKSNGISLIFSRNTNGINMLLLVVAGRTAFRKN